ncbi:MAG: hypothetical protein N2Z85_00700 [Patescibacteria group bacterium]|nr:hypothetical protein [Patescibacteria group bacterium]
MTNLEKNNRYQQEQRMRIESKQRLIKNIERRSRLLKLISQKISKEEKEVDIPDIVIKNTLLKFLDKRYNNEDIEKIKDLNLRIFVLLNRFTTLLKKPDTSSVTSLYAYQKKDSVDILEKKYNEFINDVKEIIKLAKEYKISIKSITGMQNGLGIPDIGELKKLFKNKGQK